MADTLVDRARDLLVALSEGNGVSGYESMLEPLVASFFRNLGAKVSVDKFGNIYAVKKGSQGRYKVMLAAHMDEVGLIVTDIDERGFLRFRDIAGVDQRTLLSQEVVIHGRDDIPGVIGTMPPHLLKSHDAKRALRFDELGIDVGMKAEEIRKVIQIGDIVTLKRSTRRLLNNVIAGKAFDDRAGVVAMAICLQELEKRHFFHDVVCVATTQEEVGLRGAVTSSFTLNPDLGIAIDVTHAASPDAKVNIELGKGTVIALGANVHPAIHKQLVRTARSSRLPYQLEAVPGHSGTDAWAMQVSQAGVPTGLVSIPLRYMHTSVETLDMQDVVHTGKLLAEFITGLPENLEELLCF